MKIKLLLKLSEEHIKEMFKPIGSRMVLSELVKGLVAKGNYIIITILHFISGSNSIRCPNKYMCYTSSTYIPSKKDLYERIKKNTVAASCAFKRGIY